MVLHLPNSFTEGTNRRPAFSPVEADHIPPFGPLFGSNPADRDYVRCWHETEVPERTGISGAGGRPAVASACRPRPSVTQSRHKESVPSNYASWTVARRTMIRSPSSRYLSSSLYSLWTSQMSTVCPFTSRSQTRTRPSFKPVSRSR